MPNSDKADKGGRIKSFNCDLQEKNHNRKKFHRGGGRGWEVQQIFQKTTFHIRFVRVFGYIGA